MKIESSRTVQTPRNVDHTMLLLRDWKSTTLHSCNAMHYLHCVSKKNRTPITFWNNSNKLCLIIIMISWENRQKELNIVVCYGLTIFHKTGYQLRCGWTEAVLGGGLVWPTADHCRSVSYTHLTLPTNREV